MALSANKILVVDDDLFQRELMGAQLASLGWRDVLFAESGLAALDLCAHYGDQIAALISDLNMPDMDGLVLMRHLVEAGFSAPVIVVSGVRDEIRDSAAMLATAHGLKLLGVLGKPCQTADLGAMLAKLKQNDDTVVSPSHVQDLTRERLMLALSQSDFVPWYQPKMEVRSGRIIGVEALARWFPAGGQAVSPAHFVPALEAHGLADALFFMLTRQVVRDLRRWQQLNLPLRAAINMSMDTAHNLQLPELLGQIVAEAGLQPADLVIEITESRLMMDRSLAMETITRLSMMGFVLSVDDFGTGYSSLVQLIDLPFRELKIDGSFVQRALSERKAQAVLRIAILLGQQLDMGVVAEGVETPEQLEFVRRVGCDVVQGHHFARAMPFAACTEWLRAAWPE
ncbi:MAG: EAL domain-containing response regulator [Rhodoferax sp.]|uniref:EAL domain-containing response regulator n=1 Tax=Rhodoferax sp. TaxID=50421 RepID=UPI001B6AC14F|nr:EAL domain-containing response regulator [Rhodoferax sp.]MBP9907132.1 EAL domain-containing response regulator [Rhodoferax sp.]